MGIVENIHSIVGKISAITDGVELVAATKTRDIEDIRLALGTGCVASCGENRVQELLSKYEPDIQWDFIGQLQTNKVKYIIDKTRLIHSVDRLALAEVINKEASKINKVQDILIEINSGKEDSKGGIYLENVEDFLSQLVKYDNIRVKGLMAVAPLFFTETELRNTFDEVFKVYQRLATEDMRYLSMGMSNDFLTAVESGANMVRIGRGVFGERNYING